MPGLPSTGRRGRATHNNNDDSNRNKDGDDEGKKNNSGKDDARTLDAATRTRRRWALLEEARAAENIFHKEEVEKEEEEKEVKGKGMDGEDSCGDKVNAGGAGAEDEGSTVPLPKKNVPRWKGNGSEAKALENPMSGIVSQLKLSLIRSNVHGLLSGCSVLVVVTEELSDILNRSCFGRPLLAAEKDKGWFQLGLEEAFYLHYYLECLPIQGEDHHPKPSEDVWRYMKNRKISFPESYRAYSHLRGKNWVVRPGTQYGVDFVAYRHHPALVHSEYAVLVLKDGDAHDNGRLRVWSDFHCAIRLCGSVAKQLLVLYVNRGGHNSESPSSVSLFSVEDRLISRWSPKECREDTTVSCESLS